MYGRTRESSGDPVDRLLGVQYEAAIRRYSNIYVESLADNDRDVGVHLCTQLLYAVGAKYERPAEEVKQQLRGLLIAEILNHVHGVDTQYLVQYLDDDLDGAQRSITYAKKRSESSVNRVESEQDENS